MIIEYIATSPSMKLQWSGKTFLSRKAPALAMPVRSSTQSAVRATAPPLLSEALASPARRSAAVREEAVVVT